MINATIIYYADQNQVPILPFLLKDRIHMPDSQIQSTTSTLLAVYAAASCAASPITGVLTDKFSSTRKLPFVLGLIMLAIATVLLALGQSVAILVVARLLQGASGGVVWTIGIAIIKDSVSQQDLGKTMGTVFSFISVAGLFSPILGGVLYSKAGYAGVFGLGIGLVVMDFVLRFLMIEKSVAARYEHHHSINQDSRHHHDPETLDPSEETPLLQNGSSDQSQYSLSAPKSRITKSLPILLLFRDPALPTALWIAFMQALLLGAFDATIPLVASILFGFTSLQAGLLFIPLGGADFLLGPVFGWCVDKYGPRLLAVCGFTFLVPALLLLRLPTDSSLTETFPQPNLIALLCGLLALNGVGLAAINAPSIVEASSLLEKYSKANKEIFEEGAPYAQLFGINSMLFSAGLTVGPLIAGNLREEIGYGNMNAVLAGICGATAVLSWAFLGRKGSGKEGEEEEE